MEFFISISILLNRYLFVLSDGFDVHDRHEGVELLQSRLGHRPDVHVPPLKFDIWM
jgi:hypothetical protein